MTKQKKNQIQKFSITLAVALICTVIPIELLTIDTYAKTTSQLAKLSQKPLSSAVPFGIIKGNGYSFKNGVLTLYTDDGTTAWQNNKYVGGTDAINTIEIKEGVKKIGNNAFSKCTKITSVIIPPGVSNIGDFAFQGCNKLRTVSVGCPTPPQLGIKVFSGADSALQIQIPKDKILIYIDKWSEFRNEIISVYDKDTPLYSFLANWGTESHINLVNQFARLLEIFLITHSPFVIQLLLQWITIIMSL